MGHHARNPASQVPGEGRSGSLDFLVRRYSRALTSFFQRRVSNQDDVPDLVQDVFLRLSRLEELPELRQPEAYLFRTASCALRDRVRRDTVRERTAHCAFDEMVHGNSPIMPDRIVSGRQAVDELRDAIARLPAL